MQLIPVIDIKEGIAVHAKLGQRETYQAINSPLSSSCEVASVIDDFLGIHPFKIFYLADLNAITQRGDNENLIKSLVLTYPQINFWVDSGYQQHPCQLIRFNNYKIVLGSECYPENKLDDLRAFTKKFILSLDFSAQGKPLGALDLFQQPSLWTTQVILMTLGRVGSNSGVDLEKIMDYQFINSAVEFIASGGIRDINDILELKNKGINKVLCASALHNKTITRDEIKKLETKKYPD